MSFKATLFIFDKEYQLINLTYGYLQPTDITGRPTSRTTGGKITAVANSTKDDSGLYEAMFSPDQMVSGEIITYRRDGFQKNFNIKFANASVSYLTTKFNAVGTDSLQLEIVFSAQIMEVRDTLYESPTNPNNPFVETTPVTTIDTQEPEITEVCLVNEAGEIINDPICYNQKIYVKTTTKNMSGQNIDLLISEKKKGIWDKAAETDLKKTCAVGEDTETFEVTPSKTWHESNFGVANKFRVEVSAIVDGETLKKSTDYIEVRDTRKKEEITIVIDAGHGHSKGNTGAAAITKYKHKVKDAKGKVKLNDKKEPIIVWSKTTDTPEYVLDDLKKPEASRKWVIKYKQDSTKTERVAVFNVAEELEKLLKAEGYNVLMTRTEALVKTGADNSADRIKRNKFASDNKADYFLSIHADGLSDYRKKGSHVIYRPSGDSEYDKNQKEFATDVFSKYTVVKSKGVKSRTNLAVLSPSQNKTPRKALVEIGYVSNEDEYNVLISEYKKIAEQLKDGFLVNIDKNFCVQ